MVTRRPGPIAGTALCTGAAALAAALLWPLTPEGNAPGTEPVRLRQSNDGEASRRPPFDPERRSWTAAGSADAVFREPPLPTRLVVKGILIDGGFSRALVDDGKGEPAWHQPGTGRDDWRVTAVTPESVTVRSGDGVYRLDFMGDDVSLPPPRRSAVAPPEASSGRAPARMIPLPTRGTPGG